MDALFKNIHERKRSICDKNIHKAMRIPVNVYQINKKFFVTAQPKQCKWEFADRLWIQFIGQPQYDIVVFAIINSCIYNILVTKWKH